MRRILLAVSGGIDSMYMANRASELIPEARFAVAHCNFCLRGEESDKDEEFVRVWCDEHGIEFHTVRFDTKTYAKQKGISIEMAARELRYTWFEQLKKDYNYEAVALAHNANDNAETLILNLLRGTGIRGIRGMSEREGILRPMLSIEREEIRNWMQAQGLSWREDSTNAESAYKRNKIRNEIFPQFEEINPAFIRTLNQNMQHFAQADDISNLYVERTKADVLTEQGDILIEPLISKEFWEFILWRLLEDSGIGHQEFASLVDCIKSKRQLAGKRFGPVIACSTKLMIEGQKDEKVLDYKIVNRSEISCLKTPKGILIADADKLSFPLKIRKWKEGDWIIPLGMQGRKKLSDMFTDLKWGAYEKREAEVIEHNGSHIAALLCERIDDSIKITPETKRVIVLSYHSIT